MTGVEESVAAQTGPHTYLWPAAQKFLGAPQWGLASLIKIPDRRPSQALLLAPGGLARTSQ